MEPEMERALNRLERQYEQQVTEVYNQAVADVTKKWEQYTKDFARKDAVKRKLVESGELSEADYLKWRKGQILIGKRWREQVDVLSKDLVNADQIAVSLTKAYMAEAYALGHNYGTFLVEKGSLVNTSYTLYSREAVERLIKDQPRLLSVTQWELNHPKDLHWNQRHITGQITQGILQGEDIRQVSKRLQKVVGMDKGAAMRNARTAMTGAQNGGRIDAYKRAESLGIELEKEWLATVDNKTRESHIELDGEHVPMDEKFSNGCMYPGDPKGKPEEVYNCRCTLIPRRTKAEYWNEKRFQRDEDLGTMSYNAWKNTHGGRDTYHLLSSDFVQDAMTQDDVDRINRRFKQLEKQYHAPISAVKTTLQRDQDEWDLYYKNMFANYKAKYPNKRNSTIDRMVVEGLGPRPTKADLLLGGDFNFDSRVLTINTRSIGIDGGIEQDISDRLRHIERNKVRVADGKRFRPFGTSGDTFESTFIHEYGHAVDATYGISKNKDFLDFYKKYSEDAVINGVSSYAATNEKEFIAECFAESFMGETQGEISKEFMKRLPGWMK